MYGLRHIAEVGCDMVLEALAADVLEQLLQLGNLCHARATESGERIVSELARATVAANDAVAVIGGVPGIAHSSALDAAYAGTEGIVFADRAGDDLLEVHLDIFEEVFGQVGAVEADALVRMAVVVVV